MSKFITKIPIDLKAVLGLLPKRAHVQEVGWDPQASQLHLRWECDDLATGLSVEVPFELGSLKKRLLPKGTRNVCRDTKPVEVGKPAAGKPDKRHASTPGKTVPASEPATSAAPAAKPDGGPASAAVD